MVSTSIANSSATLAAAHSRLQHFPNFAPVSVAHGLKDFRPSPFALALKRSTNGSFLPIIRAQSSPGTTPFSWDLFQLLSIVD